MSLHVMHAIQYLYVVLGYCPVTKVVLASLLKGTVHCFRLRRHGRKS